MTLRTVISISVLSFQLCFAFVLFLVVFWRGEGGRGVSGQVEIDGFRRSLQTVGKAGHQTPGWRGLPPSCLEGEAGVGEMLC